MRRFMLFALAASLVAGPTGAVSGRPTPCPARLLVLSAVPGEIDRLLVETTVTDSAVVEGHTFYIGTLRGNAVVLALTGVGLVNAEDTARTALASFRCGSRTMFGGIVFSGVSGGKSFIGDVTVASRWTLDDGKTWYPTNARMFAVARSVIEGGGVRLADRTPLGDIACVGLDPNLVSTVTMPNPPKIIVGGDGKSADPFGGRAFPCLPGGSDVFGCQPCRAPLQAPDVARFVNRAAPFVDPDFFLGYFQQPTPADHEWVAEDMETAAVARVATEYRIPFIAFRALSDGKGDPLNLPGFPVQFFVYRQLAADNAATVALAFLEAWGRR